MMKRFLFVSIAVLMGMSASAQNVQFGIKGGLNMSKESNQIYNIVNNGTYEIDTHFRPGINIGGLVNITTGNKSELEAGVSYSMLGYKDKIYEDASSNDYFYAKVMSHYLTIPIAEKYYPFGDGIYIEFGPQVGFLISKKASLKDGAAYTQFEGNNRIFDFSVLGGLGYKFSNHFFVDARYIHSFTETCKLYEGGKNRNFQISVGYLF